MADTEGELVPILGFDRIICTPTPALAGTAETMEPENGEWLAQKLDERCGCHPDRNECCDWCQGAAMVRRVCAALAESQREVERLKCRHSDAWEEIAKLRASLATAQEDTRRLDWLEGTGESYCNRDRVDRWGSKWISFNSEAAVEANDPTGRHAGIRAAIDARRPPARHTGGGMTSRVCRCAGIVPGIVHPDCPIHAPTRDAEQAAEREKNHILCQFNVDEGDLNDLITAVRQAEREQMTDLDSVIGTCADGSPYTVRMLVGTDAKLMTALKAEARTQAFADVRRVVEGIAACEFPEPDRDLVVYANGTFVTKQALLAALDTLEGT